MAFYQIGQFASKLGVTRDLLKHYEKYGIIESVRHGDGGYRHYPFSQAPYILHSKSFQNLGFSLREIAELLTEPDHSKYYQSLLKHVDTMEQQQTLNDAYLKSARQLLHYAQQIEKGQFNGSWSIENTEPCFYLPHSSGDDSELIDIDPDVLTVWTNHLPITSIATRIYGQDQKANYTKLSHGLLITESDAHKFGIPLPEQVIPMVGRKYLIYQSSLPIVNHSLTESIRAILEDPFTLVRKHHFDIQGDIYSRTLFQFEKKGDGTIHRMIYLPLDL
jgi:DNA-binding transcriptional MerR regulator